MDSAMPAATIPELTIESDPADESPEYLAYLVELEADDQRRCEREGKPAPMQWGTDLSNNSYFCEPCWRNGVEDGAHSHEFPPCDAAPRGPFDPR